MKKHDSLTVERIMAAAEADDNIGLCVACGNEQYGCEPDARKYECEECGKLAVYGAEELMFHVVA